MGEEKKEEEVKKEEKKDSGKASKFVDFLGKVMKLFENIPKAVVGIGVVVSLVAGGTGAWGTFSSPHNKEFKAMEKRIHDMEVRNGVLMEITIAALSGKSVQCESVEFEGFLLDLETNEVEPLTPKK